MIKVGSLLTTLGVLEIREYLHEVFMKLFAKTVEFEKIRETIGNRKNYFFPALLNNEIEF